jgi:hypothetical protein
MAAVMIRVMIVLAAAALGTSGQTVAKNYVGSKTCYGCHNAIYQSFLQTDMGRSMSVPGDAVTASLPAEATVSLPGNAHVFSVARKDGGWVETESEAGVFAVEHKLAYTVGSGANGLTFLIRRGNYLLQAPLSYYSKTHAWDFSPGYERADLGFSRVVPEECINCHTGRAAPVENRPGAYAETAFPELAIGCENCHGPGDAHVRTEGKLAGAIVNPAKLPSRLAENICVNCHQSGDTKVLQAGKNFGDFRPGQWLFDTAVILKQPAHTTAQREADLLEHYSAMQASRCFRESSGKLGCLTCHDPHVQPRREEVAGYYRAKCLTCHNEQSCSLSIKARSAQKPPDDCAGCHMQKREIQQISHSALTNHRIPARAGEPTPSIPQTETDGLVVVNLPPGRSAELSKLMLLRAYAELSPKNAEYGQRYSDLLDELSKTQPTDVFVQGALGHRAFAEGRYDEAVTHLKLALPLENGGVNLELGQALAKLGKSDESIEYLKKGVAIDPYNAVIQKTLILQYINAKAYAAARMLMEQYVDSFPEDSFMRNMLTRVSR